VVNVGLIDAISIGEAPNPGRVGFVYLDFSGDRRRSETLGYVALKEHS